MQFPALRVTTVLAGFRFLWCNAVVSSELTLPRPALIPWRWALLCTTAAALLLGGRGWIAIKFYGTHVPWWSPFLEWLLCLWYWALCTPLVAGLARRFHLGRRTWLRNGLILIAAGAALSTVAIVLDNAAVPLLRHPVLVKMSFAQRLRVFAVGVWHSEFITFAILIACAHATAYYSDSRDKERRAARLGLEMARLEASLNQAQLQALRMQLNPHFLFNALNTVAVLINEAPRAAYDVLIRLSDLLRATINSNQENEIPLRRELDFLRDYLEIEKVRFQDRLTPRLSVDPATLDALVPIFLLQPLVENAIRHAVAVRSAPCTVEVRAVRNNGVLQLDVADDGPGLNGRKREGIGLSNTRERLARLYPDRYSFELADSPGHGLTVRISIPYHETGAENGGTEQRATPEGDHRR
jgi:signal transduction histidine kinase